VDEGVVEYEELAVNMLRGLVIKFEVNNTIP
jgi:hypothetical protein